MTEWLKIKEQISLRMPVKSYDILSKYNDFNSRILEKMVRIFSLILWKTINSTGSQKLFPNSCQKIK